MMQTYRFFFRFKTSPSFTLVELLVVIGILAVLATVVVLVINPAELFREGRDSTRVTDLRTLNTALILADLESINPGTAATIYVSLPDSDSGCANWGLPSLPTGYSYACATSANYRKVDGTGWIPVAFSSIIQGSPLAQLPIDPVNTTTTGNYYTYTPGGSWELTAVPESAQYRTQASKDGGVDSIQLEMGSNLSLSPFAHGLLGFWRFEEGTGSIAYDSSGLGNHLTWSGSSDPHYTTGKVGTYAGRYVAANSDYFTAALTTGIESGKVRTGDFTVMFWTKSASNIGTLLGTIAVCGADNSWQIDTFERLYINAASQQVTPTPANYGSAEWHHVTVVRSGATVSGFSNGSLLGTNSASPIIDSNTAPINGGKSICGGYISGNIDNIRFYGRALTANEIAAIYASEN